MSKLKNPKTEANLLVAVPAASFDMDSLAPTPPPVETPPTPLDALATVLANMSSTAVTARAAAEEDARADTRAAINARVAAGREAFARVTKARDAALPLLTRLAAVEWRLLGGSPTVAYFARDVEALHYDLVSGSFTGLTEAIDAVAALQSLSTPQNQQILRDLGYHVTNAAELASSFERRLGVIQRDLPKIAAELGLTVSA
jgi:hypothetical protein